MAADARCSTIMRARLPIGSTDERGIMRNPAAELLELRYLLAGNVTAQLIDGDLVIQGDAAGNSIELVGSPDDPRVLVVSPVDDGTTLNGSAEPVAFTGIGRHVVISLGAGNDSVSITAAQVKQDVQADLGAGDDLISTSGLSVGRDLSIEALDGEDRILLSSTNVDRWTGLSGGAGKDAVALAETTHRQKLRVLGGIGNDTCAQTRSSFPQSSEFNLGRGDDELLLDPQVLKWDFNTQGRPGWRTGAADWDRTRRDDYQFEIDHRPLPDEVAANQTAFLISSNNASDDVFTFIHRHISGPFELERGRTYIAMIILDFASNAPSGAFGIGGAPGESVYFKSGITNQQPAIDPAQQAHSGLNVDHGEQSRGGAAASVVSNIANGLNAADFSDLGAVPYVQLHRAHIHPVPVQTSGDGFLYFIGGIESGFEGKTSIYVRRVQVVLVPVPE